MTINIMITCALTRFALCDTANDFLNAEKVSAATACCVCGGGEVAHAII